ncbi:MAG: patatin-like phospholipase family protein [Cystobacterineae bacterium]|nr:patatin-like phospholipase family protein [Cystobacterineae bacterium]
MAYHFKNLIFEGGGVKGVGYIGALEILEERGILAGIQRIGGTSAGAINAVLAGLNFSPQESKKILWEMDFKEFLDGPRHCIGYFNHLRTNYGFFKGDFFREWIGERIQQKTGNSEATFADIEALKGKEGFRSMYLMGTNLSTGFSEVFSAEHTPGMCVADAARISMSYPFAFGAVRIKGDCYVDGGLTDNYPVKLFDRISYLKTKNFVEADYYNKKNLMLERSGRPMERHVYNQETLGFRLDSREEIHNFRDHVEPSHHQMKGFFDFGMHLFCALLEVQGQYHLHSDDWQRTVYIDTLGIGTLSFGISAEKKQALLESGRNETEAYLKWYDNNEPKANKQKVGGGRL